MLLWIALGVIGGGLLLGAIGLLVAPDPTYRFRSWMALGRYSAHDAVFSEAGAEVGIDANLLKALAWKLSAFDARKAGANGGCGLFQVDAATARAWAAARRVETFMLTDLYDPQTNARVASWALARARDRWKATDAPEIFALTEHAVVRRGGKFAPTATASTELLASLTPEDRDLVESVRKRFSFYQRNGW